MRGLAAISSFMVRLMAATIVSGRPSGSSGVSKADEVGSTSGEYTQRPAVSGVGFGEAIASSVARAISRSTSAAISAISASVASPCASRWVRIRTIGSRAASASRSSGVL